jgi:hypothetical protein
MFNQQKTSKHGMNGDLKQPKYGDLSIIPETRRLILQLSLKRWSWFGDTASIKHMASHHQNHNH